MPLSLFQLYSYTIHIRNSTELLFIFVALWCVLTMTIGSVFNLFANDTKSVIK